ncbi:hypothetical protein phiAS5_ORF0025 [Aeromonas phage phiAS5]|uniref:Uncharacterized protein n=1 Tax=Aeromonas phage phiAS5 TaxID=879630 RepID=E1A2C2_9CAUD|nr:hypothetical protein phiAS5_ORF0025 [Aeromonas phage phiAS5]ADM79868.1 hypothetical protein phiAS5_ORF0025 [Aeromonas phage phiAS5]BES53026.1 hypothetical protein [Aeromonas phage phiWae14]
MVNKDKIAVHFAVEQFGMEKAMKNFEMTEIQIMNIYAEVEDARNARKAKRRKVWKFENKKA